MPWRASDNPVVQARWRERVNAYEASTLSLRAFAVDAGLGVESLGRWRRWFRSQSDGVAQLPALVQVQVSSPAPPLARDHMVVELAHDRRLHLEPGFDRAAVARLLSILDRL